MNAIVERGQLTIEPLTPSLGATVKGVDLSKPIADSVLSEIRAAYLDHLVLAFPNQAVTPQRQIEIAGLFGTPEAPRKFRQYDAERFPEIGLLDQYGSEKYVVGNVWHSDNMDYEDPYATLVFYSEAIPDVGGDTLFSNMYAAYDGLSDPIKAMLDGMRALNDNSRTSEYGAKNPNYVSKGLVTPEPKTHPVIRTHPVTKRKLLYVNPAFTRKIVGLNSTESDAVLRMLFSHVEKRPEYQCRLRWQNQMLVIWDNRSVQHYACSGYSGHRRLRRVEVKGDRPF